MLTELDARIKELHEEVKQVSTKKEEYEERAKALRAQLEAARRILALLDKIEKDVERDYFMTAKEALEYEIENPTNLRLFAIYEASFEASLKTPAVIPSSFSLTILMAFCVISQKFLPIAITSPTDFIWVPRSFETPVNFVRSHLGTFNVT